MPKIISSDSPGIVFKERPVKDVQLFVSESVIGCIADHADSGYHNSKEVMGLLIGEILRDDDGPYVRATDIATSDLDADEVSVRFRKDKIEELFTSMDRCKDHAVVGWYHSHLGIGCYLSDVDIKTHVGIFGDDIGFALVIDPTDSTLAPFSCVKGETQKVQMIILT